VAAFLIAICSALTADEWPQFRGPRGTGIAASAAPVELKQPLWSAAVPPGQSSPTIWGDKIFLTAGDKQTRKLELLCFDRRNGKLLWRREVVAEKIEKLHEITTPATATPLVDGERVYAYFGSHGLTAYDLNGQERWSLKLPAASKNYGSGASPILAGEAVLLNRDDVADPHLLALDRRTGKQIWKQAYEPETFSSAANTATPVLWRDEVVIHRSREIAAFSVRDGSKKWWVQVQSTGTGTPVAAPEALYVGTWLLVGEPDLRVALPYFAELLQKHDKDQDGSLTPDEFPDIPFARRIEMTVTGANNAISGKSAFPNIDQNKDGKIDKAEWDAFAARRSAASDHGLLAIKPGGQGDVTSTNVLWREARGVPEIPAPLYSNGRVYMVTNRGIVTCMDAASGAVLFRNRLGAGGAYYASPVVAGQHVYFASGDGVISVIKDEAKFEVLARNDLGKPIFATPAMVDGVLYVRAGEQLLAFDSR
jgi:outer membrane protein assembly factor BamB